MSEGIFENGFIIDLSNAKDTSEIVSELSGILEMSAARGKNICLKLGNIELSQAQLLSIKSLIESMNSQLAFIDTKSSKTVESANETNITVSSLSNEIRVEADEEKSVVEVQDIDASSENNGENPENSTEKEENKTYELLSDEHKTENDKNEENSDNKTENELKSEISKYSTLYLRQNLRSGQTMSYDGNIVLIGDTNPGSEIVAKGDITVWGVIGGIAHAGSNGNHLAKIRALKLNAIQIRISGYYARRPDMSNIPFISRSSQFTPEEASVEDGTIVIRKMNEN